MVFIKLRDNEPSGCKVVIGAPRKLMRASWLFQHCHRIKEKVKNSANIHVLKDRPENHIKEAIYHKVTGDNHTFRLYSFFIINATS